MRTVGNIYHDVHERLNASCRHTSSSRGTTREYGNNLSWPSGIILPRDALIWIRRRFIEQTTLGVLLGRNWRKFSTRLNETRTAAVPSKSYACPKATLLHAWLDIRSKVRVSPIFRENFRRGSRLRNPRRFLRRLRNWPPRAENSTRLLDQADHP